MYQPRVKLTASSKQMAMSLQEENAKLKEMLASQSAMPPSPPLSPKRVTAPIKTSTVSLPALPLDESNPLYSVIEMLRSQLMAQATAQEGLLSQLGELRSSHAVLQASTCDVNDELVLLKDKASKMSVELQDERKKREEAEKEKMDEAEKVANLRQKMEESRRAIMRLQEEAAAKRNSDSRRSSIVSLATPTSSVIGQGMDSRRGSMSGMNSFAFPSQRRISLISGMDNAAGRLTPGNEVRRASFAGPSFSHTGEAKRHSIAVEPNRRASCAFAASASAASSPGVGLGLEFADPPVPSRSRGSLPNISKRRGSALAIGAVDNDTKEELRALVLKSAANEAASAVTEDETIALLRRQSNLCLSTQIDEEGPGSTRIIQRRTLRMSQDLGDGRNLPNVPRAGSWNGFQRPQEKSDNAELQILKAQLSAMQVKLAQTEEAREASDACLKALKDYVSSSASALKLPPLPSDSSADELEAEEKPAKAISRRSSLWTLSGLVGKADTPKADIENIPPTRKPSKSSPVLTEFNGWSARRRASTIALKDKVNAKPLEQSPRSSSHAIPTFGAFSFQSRAYNPALVDSPLSPGGGFSPSGHRRSSVSEFPSNNLAAPIVEPISQTPCGENSGVFPDLPTSGEFEGAPMLAHAV